MNKILLKRRILLQGIVVWTISLLLIVFSFFNENYFTDFAIINLLVISCFSILSFIYIKSAINLEEEKLQHSKIADALFDDNEGVIVAQRYANFIKKIAISLGGILLALFLAISSLYFINYWTKKPIDDVSLSYINISFQLFFAVALFITGSFYNGLSREKGNRILFAVGSYLIYIAIIYFVGGIITLLFKYGVADLFLWAKVMLYFNVILAIDLFANVILEFYRPQKEQSNRLIFESRILAVLLQPGSIVKNLSLALDYQFGFKVSHSNLYIFLRKKVFPLICLQLFLLYLLSCVVKIEEDEVGIKRTFGKLVDAKLTAGLYFKLPYPFSTIEVKPYRQIRTINIGYTKQTGLKDSHSFLEDEKDDELANKDVILWSRKHRKDESKFIIPASKNNNELLNLINVNIPLNYRIVDPYKYYVENKDSHKQIHSLANEIVLSYLSKSSFEEVLKIKRRVAQESITENIKEKTAHLGIEIVDIFLEEVHLPSELIVAYDDVTNKKYQQEIDVLQADKKKSEIISQANIAKLSLLTPLSANVESYLTNYKEYYSYLTEVVDAIDEKIDNLSLSEDEKIQQKKKAYEMYAHFLYSNILKNKLQNPLMKKYFIQNKNKKISYIIDTKEETNFNQIFK